MSRIIVITSGKGGVGKTTVTANLGRALASLNTRVAALDIDLGLNNLDVALGLENKVVYDLVDVIEGRCRARQALIEDEIAPNLFLLPSCHSFDRSKISAGSIKAVIESLATSFDYILIDCPAGIEVGFHRAVSASEEALVVITPHISSIRDADKVINLLKSYRLNSICAVINRARGDLMLTYKTADIDDIADLLKIKPIGVIPEDDCLNSMGMALSAQCYDAFLMLANAIHNGDEALYDVTHKYRGFFGKLKRNLRKLI